MTHWPNKVDEGKRGSSHRSVGGIGYDDDSRLEININTTGIMVIHLSLLTSEGITVITMCKEARRRLPQCYCICLGGINNYFFDGRVFVP